LIIAKSKPIEEILKSLEGEKKVFILGCGECATVTQTGGEKEVAAMKAKLEEAGKEVVAIDMAAADCQELDVKRILRQHKEASEEAEVFLVMSCGAGTQSVRAATDKHVVPANDSLFLGNVQRNMDFAEKCSLCGHCVLDEYGAICPVTRCAKGLLNGPCGGTSHGKCEVDPEMDCAWVLIHEQLKKEGREDKRTKIHEPKEWNVIAKPGKLKEEREKHVAAAAGDKKASAKPEGR
jgi:Methylene-tetrahydrofolate reductase C terminal